MMQFTLKTFSDWNGIKCKNSETFLRTCSLTVGIHVLGDAYYTKQLHWF